MDSARESVHVVTATPHSEVDAFEFRRDARYDFFQNFFRVVLTGSTDVEFRVIQFRVAREVVCIVNFTAVVESLTKHLQSGVALADDSQSKFIFFFKEDFDRHCNRSCHLPTCFEPSPVAEVNKK